MNAVALLSLVVLSGAAIGCAIRLVTTRTLGDRILALDLILIIIVVGIAVEAARSGSGAFLDLLVLIALIAFIGTVSAARFIEQRGQ